MPFSVLPGLQDLFLTSPDFFPTATVAFIEFTYYLVARAISAGLELWCLHAGMWRKVWSDTSSQSPRWKQAKVMVPAGTRRLKFSGFLDIFLAYPNRGWWIVDAVVASQPQGQALDFLSLCSAFAHNCALHISTGQLKCWGLDDSGSLGYGLTLLNREVGDSLDEMGSNLPVVDLGSGSKARQVACQRYYNCAVLHCGALKCWGSVVDGVANHDYEPREISLGVGAVVVQIACGIDHACALLDTGAVKCFGKRQYLGLADGPRP